MPSIALFIKELLAEEKYDGTFTSKIDERIKVLNAAQLQGLYNHLSSTANTSKTELWRTANQEIVDRIKDTLDERMKQVAAEQKIIDEHRLQQKQKKMAVVEAERERQRVQQMIYQKAHDQAEQEVRNQEMAREAKEKLDIMQRVFQAEEKRNKCLMGTAGFFIIGCAIVIVGVLFLAQGNILYIGAGIGLVVIITAGLIYYAVNLTKIKPQKVLPEDLEAQIETREQVLQEEAYLVLKEKEKKFEEQERRDKIERKRRRQQRREQKQYEIELMEQQRLERIQMAREIVEREQHQKQSMPTLQPSSSVSSLEREDSLENHAPESMQASLTSYGNNDGNSFRHNDDDMDGDIENNPHQSHHGYMSSDSIDSEDDVEQVHSHYTGNANSKKYDDNTHHHRKSMNQEEEAKNSDDAENDVQLFVADA